MTTKIFLSIVVLNIFILKAFSQGVHFGMTTGTNLLGLEVGYSLKDNFHTGVQIIPNNGFGSTNGANYEGVYLRTNFKESGIGNYGGDISFSHRIFFTGNIGIVNSKIAEQYLYDNDNNIYKTIPASKNTRLGGYVGGGIEFIWGYKGKITTPIEIGYGYMPSYYAQLSSTLSSINSSTYIEKTTSVFYVGLGVRYYFRKNYG